jgi:hypothetical protein
MKRILALLLVLSLAANAWLLSDSRHTSATPPAASAKPASPAASTTGIPATAFAADDLTALRDALRAGGADEATVRAVLEGVLRRRSRDKLAELRIERARHAWWQVGRNAPDSFGEVNVNVLQKPLLNLLGPDPLLLRDAESRYAFLPPDKRRKLAQIDLDYLEMHAQSARQVGYVATEQLLVEERRKDLIAGLTPEERAEFDLRFGDGVGMAQFNGQIRAFAPTEAEVRAYTPILLDMAAQTKALPRYVMGAPGPQNDAYLAGSRAIERTAAQRLVNTLGYDRASQFMWAGFNTDYSALQHAAREAQLPANTPARVMDLAMDVAQRAMQIHDDSALTPEQKRAALLPLQQMARDQLDTILPSGARQNLPPEALRWLNELGNGRYVAIMPSLRSSGGYAPTTITSPPPAQRSPPFTLPRPATGK